ncbi:MAG: cell division protein FtsZ [Candidatus Paceibacterota bacterium]|jgi:cell division protein FtsZ
MKKNIKIKQKTKPVKINSKALVNKKKNKTTKKAVVKKSQAKVLVKKNKKPVSKIVKKNKTTKPRLVSEPIKPIKIDKEIDSSKKIRIKIIGIGGGGSNIVSELSKKLKDFSSQKVDFVAANTDTQALSSLSRNIKTFPFGQKLTRGLGTGRDVGLGERAARDDFEKLKNIFLEDKDLYIVISSLGGGTGTGSAPVFAKAASDLGLSVLGIFTLPFVFEGKKKMDAALDALEKMKENLNAYMVLPNEKIFNLAKEEVSFTESLNLLNNHLANSLEGLLRTIYSPGLINIDWADIKTILEGKKKVAYLNVVKGKINQNLDDFIKTILKNPILDSQFANADNVLFNVEGSKDLSLQALSQISEKISEMSPNAKIIFGLIQNPKMKNDIKVTILATISAEIKEGRKVKSKLKQKLIKQQEVKTGLVSIKKKDKSIAGSKPIENIKKETITNKSPEKEEEDENNEESVNIRRNALEIKEAERKAIEKEEEDERIFEIPAFLRKDKKK